VDQQPKFTFIFESTTPVLSDSTTVTAPKKESDTPVSIELLPTIPPKTTEEETTSSSKKTTTTTTTTTRAAYYQFHAENPSPRNREKSTLTDLTTSQEELHYSIENLSEYVTDPVFETDPVTSSTRQQASVWTVTRGPSVKSNAYSIQTVAETNKPVVVDSSIDTPSASNFSFVFEFSSTPPVPTTVATQSKETFFFDYPIYEATASPTTKTTAIKSSQSKHVTSSNSSSAATESDTVSTENHVYETQTRSSSTAPTTLGFVFSSEEQLVHETSFQKASEKSPPAWSPRTTTDFLPTSFVSYIDTNPTFSYEASQEQHLTFIFESTTPIPQKTSTESMVPTTSTVLLTTRTYMNMDEEDLNALFSESLREEELSNTRKSSTTTRPSSASVNELEEQDSVDFLFETISLNNDTELSSSSSSSSTTAAHKDSLQWAVLVAESAKQNTESSKTDSSTTSELLTTRTFPIEFSFEIETSTTTSTLLSTISQLMSTTSRIREDETSSSEQVETYEDSTESSASTEMTTSISKDANKVDTTLAVSSESFATSSNQPLSVGSDEGKVATKLVRPSTNIIISSTSPRIASSPQKEETVGPVPKSTPAYFRPSIVYSEIILDTTEQITTSTASTTTTTTTTSSFVMDVSATSLLTTTSSISKIFSDYAFLI
jgi:hypothetical protein